MVNVWAKMSGSISIECDDKMNEYYYSNLFLFSFLFLIHLKILFVCLFVLFCFVGTQSLIKCNFGQNLLLVAIATYFIKQTYSE